MKKKLLVCGGTGFIGRNIAEKFAADPDYEVFATYHHSAPYSFPGVTLVKADLTKPEEVSVLLKGKDMLIQAAATTSGAKDIVNKPHYHVTDNAVMNALLFRGAAENNISHVVFFSCTTMYKSSDKAVKETDFDANADMSPVYFGGAWTKVYNEKMCEFYSRISKTRFSVIRHSNIYGPYDKFDLERSHVFGATVTKVMKAADNGKLVVWGEGTEERDLLFISDLVELTALVLKMQSSSFELFNAGCGSSISVRKLVETIIRRSGKNLSIEHDLSKPSIKTKLFLDIKKAGELFGWKPRTTLEEGIDKTIKWYKTNILK